MVQLIDGDIKTREVRGWRGVSEQATALVADAMCHKEPSEPGLRVTGAGPHAASICRSDPRWEPYAGKPHVRFCAGGAQ